MRRNRQLILGFVYGLVEQLVFYVAAIVGLLVWLSYGNLYASLAVFILIGLIFWLLPLSLKRKR